MVSFKDLLKEWWVWVIALMALILWLSSCEQEKTTLYICKSGQHDFKPSPAPLPFSAKTMTGWARLDSSCWYNDLGEDNADWNKLAGVYRYADGYKNKNSFILAWRPDIKIRDVFELCLYENIAGANVPHESATFKVKSDQLFKFTLEEINGKYMLYIDGVFVDVQRNTKPFKTVGIVSAWFGGNRTAPHDMSLQMDY